MHHTIAPGDTLKGISQLHGVDVDELYRRNRGTIEAAAWSHGQASSNMGTLLYAGTTLNVGTQSWVP